MAIPTAIPSSYSGDPIHPEIHHKTELHHDIDSPPQATGALPMEFHPPNPSLKSCPARAHISQETTSWTPRQDPPGPIVIPADKPPRRDAPLSLRSCWLSDQDPLNPVASPAQSNPLHLRVRFPALLLRWSEALAIGRCCPAVPRRRHGRRCAQQPERYGLTPFRPLPGSTQTRHRAPWNVWAGLYPCQPIETLEVKTLVFCRHYLIFQVRAQLPS